MAVNMWESPVIMGVAKRVEPRFYFFGSYFNRTPAEYHYSDLIVLDEEEESLLITPYAHPDAEAVTVRNTGFKSRYFEPACIKDKAKLTSKDGLVRLAGEPIGDLKNAPERIKKRYAQLITNMMLRYHYRLEQMACELIKTGTLSIEPDKELKSNPYVINFERHEDLRQELDPAAHWTKPDADIGGQLEEWSSKLLLHSGGHVEKVVVGSQAWAWLKQNKKFAELYALNKGNQTNIPLDPEKPIKGIKYRGNFGEFPIYEHVAQYRDPNTGVLNYFVEPNEIVILSSAIEGNRHFAVIKDMEANYKPMDYFMKSWDKKEPSAKFVKIESHPLLLLKGKDAANAAMTIKVGVKGAEFERGST